MKIAKHLCFPDGSYNGSYNGSYTVPTRFLRFLQKPTHLPSRSRPRPAGGVGARAGEGDAWAFVGTVGTV